MVMFVLGVIFGFTFIPMLLTSIVALIIGERRMPRFVRFVTISMIWYAAIFFAFFCTILVLRLVEDAGLGITLWLSVVVIIVWSAVTSTLRVTKKSVVA